MDIFFEEILGILPPLKRESYRAALQHWKMVLLALCRVVFLEMLHL